MIYQRGDTDIDGCPALRYTISGGYPNSLNYIQDIDYANNYLRKLFKALKFTDNHVEHVTELLMGDLLKKTVIRSG